MWFNFAPLILLFISDIPHYAPGLQLTFRGAFLGGIVRILNIFQHGLPSSSVSNYIIIGAILTETLLVPVLFALLRLGTADEAKES